MKTRLTEIEAAIRVRMSPTLLRWFTSYAPKYGSTRKLPHTEENEEYFYDTDELDSFNKFLWEPWPWSPGRTRPTVPKGIETEIMIEAHHKCAFCEYIAHGEAAHIDPVSRSKCNHPHNLIWACPTHHTEYDHKLKVHSVITTDHVKLMKDLMLGIQLSHWRIELRKASTQLSLIAILKKIIGLLENSQLLDIHKGLESQLRGLLQFTSDEAAKPYLTSQAKGSKVLTTYQDYLTRISSIIPNRDSTTRSSLGKVVQKVVDATEEYLEQNGLAECPLCKGNGEHNHRTCPVCAGEGTVKASSLPEIDLSPFEQVKCPLCEGEGTHNSSDCPVCLGVGTVDEQDSSEIDLGAFDQVECPLCKGSGTHNRISCPVCLGVGTIDQRDEDDMDLSAFEQVECPVCNGKGTRHGGFECEICHGEGRIDHRDEEELDLSFFEQVDCPLCETRGTFHDSECPVCKGEHKVDRGYADEIDLDQFRE